MLLYVQYMKSTMTGCSLWSGIWRVWDVLSVQNDIWTRGGICRWWFANLTKKFNVSLSTMQICWIYRC